VGQCNFKEGPRQRKKLFLLFFGGIALFADFVFLDRFFAAGMGTFFTLSYCFVAAGGFLLAFFAQLMLLMRFDTTLVVAFLSFGFRFDATTLTSQGGARSDHKSKSKRQSRKNFYDLHAVSF